MSPEQLKLDIAEFRRLIELTDRIRVKNGILSEIAKLEKELAALPPAELLTPPPPAAAVQADNKKDGGNQQQQGKGGKGGKKGKGNKGGAKQQQTNTNSNNNDSNNSSTPSNNNNASSATAAIPGQLPTVKLNHYAWDQSIKFVKIYVTFEKAGDLKPEQVKTDFTETSFALNINAFDGKNLEFVSEGLLRPIDAEKSYHKIKSDSVLLMLKKSIEGEEWDAITKVGHVERAKHEVKTPAKNVNPQAGVWQMMRQMYKSGDDDMKRSIKKALYESKQGGAPHPGLPVPHQ